MDLRMDWERMVRLREGRKNSVGYTLNLSKITTSPGVYVFGRRWGSSGFEALYVGKAGKIRSRVKSQLNNLRLMQHVHNAKNGKRIALAGRLVTKPGKSPKIGQRLLKSMALAERALIRHFLSEGDDLVNKHGTRLRRHELQSSGKHPKRFFPRQIFLERGKGE